MEGTQGSQRTPHRVADLPAMEDQMVIDGVMYYTAKEIALTTFTLGLLIAFAIIGVLLLLREIFK